MNSKWPRRPKTSPNLNLFQKRAHRRILLEGLLLLIILTELLSKGVVEWNRNSVIEKWEEKSSFDILFLICWFILCEGKLVVSPQQTTVMVSIFNVSLRISTETFKLRDLHQPCIPTKTKCLNSPIFDNAQLLLWVVVVITDQKTKPTLHSKYTRKAFGTVASINTC